MGRTEKSQATIGYEGNHIMRSHGSILGKDLDCSFRALYSRLGLLVGRMLQKSTNILNFEESDEVEHMWNRFNKEIEGGIDAYCSARENSTEVENNLSELMLSVAECTSSDWAREMPVGGVEKHCLPCGETVVLSSKYPVSVEEKIKKHTSRDDAGMNQLDTLVLNLIASKSCHC